MFEGNEWMGGIHKKNWLFWSILKKNNKQTTFGQGEKFPFKLFDSDYL